MDLWRGSRKWLPALCAIALTACGDDDPKPAAAKPPQDAELQRRCTLPGVTGFRGFPPGLLPTHSVIVGDGAAMVAGELPEVFEQLKQGAENAGLEVRGSEMETFDAELELEGPDGEIGLRLSVPRSSRSCAHAVEVQLAG